MSVDDVLVRYTVACFDDGGGRRYRHTLQNDDKYIAFNKHVAAELIKQEVLATNPELAHELKRHVEQCAAHKQGRGARAEPGASLKGPLWVVQEDRERSRSRVHIAIAYCIYVIQLQISILYMHHIV